MESPDRIPNTDCIVCLEMNCKDTAEHAVLAILITLQTNSMEQIISDMCFTHRRKITLPKEKL